MEVLKEGGWNAVVFGGLLRDLVLYGPKAKPRDVDIVVDCSPEELVSHFRNYQFEQTRFGGLRVQYQLWNFDIWSLRDTWAFKISNIPVSFENLPKTTFFNMEAVAADLGSSRGKERAVYSYGFESAVVSRILDINFEPNPFPQLCIVRALLMAAKHGFLISPRLATYITEQASHTDIDSILRAQAKHYGVPRLRVGQTIHWLNQIERHLEEDPESPVRLPMTWAKQLQLPF